MKKLHLKWKDIEKSLSKMADQLKESNFKTDVIISIGRGGMVPARILADMLEVDEVTIIPAKMYTGVGTRNARPLIGNINISIKHRNVLVVDDIVDSGLTIDAVIDYLQKSTPSQIKTVTVAIKEDATVKPSYSDVVAKKEEWIVFPWERFVEFSE